VWLPQNLSIQVVIVICHISSEISLVLQSKIIANQLSLYIIYIYIYDVYLPADGEYTETCRRSRVDWYRLYIIICTFGCFLIIQNKILCFMSCWEWNINEHLRHTLGVSYCLPNTSMNSHENASSHAYTQMHSLSLGFLARYDVKCTVHRTLQWEIVLTKNCKHIKMNASI
jgi:hypothetical protein